MNEDQVARHFLENQRLRDENEKLKKRVKVQFQAGYKRALLDAQKHMSEEEGMWSEFIEEKLESL